MVVEEVWVEKTDTSRPFASALENGAFDTGLRADALTAAAFSEVMPVDTVEHNMEPGAALSATAGEAQTHAGAAAGAEPVRKRVKGKRKAEPSRDTSEQTASIPSFYHQTKQGAPTRHTAA